MRRLLALLAVAFSAGVAPVPAFAGQCGLPDNTAWWMDFSDGSVAFRDQIFGRPGVVAATTGTAVPRALRNRGAQTVYWEMNLWQRVGTPTAPADPTGIDAEAADLVATAAASSGCPTPVIALNELLSPNLPTPWTPGVAQYRANVLALVQGLNARGARPYLLVPGRPNTAGDAANWWLAVSQSADIVVQTYLDAPTLAQQGPLLASRTIRQAYRGSVRTLSAIGVPLTRIGIMLGFQSGPGQKGREGLQPQAAWLEVVKLQTLAARQIAVDESIGSVWSWGWGTFSASGNDPDKALAACVYLWARDPALCDAPTAAGPAFDASREEGQLILPPGLLCSFAGGQIAEADVQALTPLAGDRRKALGVLFTRALLYDRYRVPWAAVARAERGVLAREFARQPAGLRQALEGRATSLGTARAVLADGLRRREVEATLPVTAVSTASVAAWAKLHLGVRTRRISVTPAAPWLGGASTGVAVATLAPAAVFTARPNRVTLVHTTTGTYRVQPLGDLRALKSLPLRDAQPAITAALRAERQRTAFPAWLAQQQQAALATATCLRDELPPTGEVDLSRNLPFLRLDAQ